MTKAITRSLILIAIFDLMQAAAVAQDCYFNPITLQPPILPFATHSNPFPQHNKRLRSDTAAGDGGR